MRFYEVKVQSNGDFQEAYYVEADNLVSQEELREYVAQVAAIDFVYSEDDSDEIEIYDPKELDENDMWNIISDVKVRPKLIITALNDITNVVLGIYHREKDYTPKTQEFFIFSAAAGQDADVTSIGCTSNEQSREEIVQEGWLDCIQQLKRYWQVPGVVVATGLFTISSISSEEYEVEYAERSVVLA